MCILQAQPAPGCHFPLCSGNLAIAAAVKDLATKAAPDWGWGLTPEQKLKLCPERDRKIFQTCQNRMVCAKKCVLLHANNLDIPLTCIKGKHIPLHQIRAV